MAKATVTLPNGTKVVFEGDPNELETVVRLLGTAEVLSSRDGTPRPPPRTAPRSRRQTGPTEYVLSAKDEGFFREKRTISDIQKKLEEMGHIYDQAHLSPPLLRLVRGQSLRRIKESGVWKYVNP